MTLSHTTGDSTYMHKLCSSAHLYRLLSRDYAKEAVLARFGVAKVLHSHMQQHI